MIQRFCGMRPSQENALRSVDWAAAGAAADDGEGEARRHGGEVELLTDAHAGHSRLSARRAPRRRLMLPLNVLAVRRAPPPSPSVNSRLRLEQAGPTLHAGPHASWRSRCRCCR